MLISIWDMAPRRHRKGLLFKVFFSQQLAFGGIVVSSAFWFGFDSISRIYLALFLMVQFLILYILKYIRLEFYYFYRSLGRNIETIYFIGKESEFGILSSWANDNLGSGIKFEALSICVKNSDSVHDFCQVCIREISDKKNMAPGNRVLLGDIDCIYNRSELERLIFVLEQMGFRIYLKLPEYLQLGSKQVSFIGPHEVYAFRVEPLLKFHNKAAKRLIDILITLPFIVFVFPFLYLFIGLFIKISSSGPVMFKQDRIGRSGKIIGVYKFRTMRRDIEAEKGYGPIDQDRVTWVGKLLRNTNIDEIPQLLNVFVGEMSLVGPRPIPAIEDCEVDKKLNRYKLRQFVKPGLTGLSAVNGLRGSTQDMSLMQKRTDVDIDYVHSWSLWLDIKICLKTMHQMFSRDNIGH